MVLFVPKGRLKPRNGERLWKTVATYHLQCRRSAKELALTKQALGWTQIEVTLINVRMQVVRKWLANIYKRKSKRTYQAWHWTLNQCHWKLSWITTQTIRLFFGTWAPGLSRSSKTLEQYVTGGVNQLGTTQAKPTTKPLLKWKQIRNEASRTLQTNDCGWKIVMDDVAIAPPTKQASYLLAET